MKIKRDFEENEHVKTISGKEFRESGALWFVNSILHLLGMAITWNPETDELNAAIVKYRGFNVESNDKGYKNLSTYFKENIDDILEDCD